MPNSKSIKTIPELPSSTHKKISSINISNESDLKHTLRHLLMYLPGKLEEIKKDLEALIQNSVSDITSERKEQLKDIQLLLVSENTEIKIKCIIKDIISEKLKEIDNCSISRFPPELIRHMLFGYLTYRQRVGAQINRTWQEYVRDRYGNRMQLVNDLVLTYEETEGLISPYNVNQRLMILKKKRKCVFKNSSTYSFINFNSYY